MVKTETIRLSTRGDGDTKNITREVERALAATKLKAGTVTVFCVGSTAGVTTIEFEEGAVSDLRACFERLVPRGIEYKHELRWHDGNGHSHVRAALLGPSLIVPFANSNLMLGTWQQIVFVDFDNRPREREVILQIIGE